MGVCEEGVAAGAKGEVALAAGVEEVKEVGVASGVREVGVASGVREVGVATMANGDVTDVPVGIACTCSTAVDNGDSFPQHLQN